MSNYKTSKEICKLLKITPMTLMRWKNNGTIACKQITSKKILYDLDSVNISSNIEEDRKNVIYARVSNTKQKQDLEHQITFIKEYMISNGIIPDAISEYVASGMNEERKSFNELLDDIFERKIDTVYISFKDRLTRFGYSYFENIFSKFGTKIKVLNLTNESSFQDELTQDLISIIHHFSMKMYSNRRKVLKDTEKQLKSSQNDEINK